MEGAQYVFQSVQLDPEFVRPRLMVGALWSPGVMDPIHDTVITFYQPVHEMELTASQQRHVEMIDARFEGRWQDAYRLAREELERDPTNSWQQIMALRTASRNNRPGVVIDLFRSLDLDPITPGMVIFGTNTHALEALHLTGRHAEELALAREILAGGPSETQGASVHANELRALAALGRAGEIDTLLTEVFLEPDPIIDDSQEMRYVVYELRAHGFRDEAQALAEQTVAWIQNVNSSSGEACVQCEAVSLMSAGRYEEARSLYEELLAEDPERYGLAYHLGVIAAHLGDRETALEMDARIVETL